MNDQQHIDQVGTHGWALFGDGGAASCYRYTLGRQLPAADHGRVLFCMLNPSTADHLVLDPTVTRCRNYSIAWGFSSMVVVNLFALRSTDPRGLRTVADPVGPENDEHIAREAAAAEAVVVAWGAEPIAAERARRVLPLLGRCWCLGTTKDGQPKHPLYLAASLSLIPFQPRT